MRARTVIGFAICAGAIGCTAVLGSFDVASGPGGTGQDAAGDVTSTDGPSSGDGSMTDGPSDAPTDATPSCPSPKVPCGTVCVDLVGNDKHCGACGRSCLGGTCTGSTCSPGLFVSRADLNQGVLAATDLDVFVTTTAGDLLQIPLATATPTPLKLATAPAGRIYAIAPAGLKVHFTVATMGGAAWDFWSATIGTGNSGVARGLSLAGSPIGLVVAGANIHTQHVTAASPETFQITSCPVMGGACGGNFNGAGRPGAKMAAGNGYVFWTDFLSDAVYAMPDTAGAVMRTAIATGEAGPDTPAWDGTTLYWQNGGSSLLRRSPYPAPAATTFQNINFSANDLLVDGTNVYYSQYDGATNQLYVIPKNAALGTAPTSIASGEIRQLRQNAFAVFWIDPATGLHAYRKP